MDVTEAVARRMSVRAFKPDPVSADVVRELLEAAKRSPSGGNLQPWRVHAISGEPLQALIAKAKTLAFTGAEAMEYDIYPKDLWAPLKGRRFQCGEDMYAILDIPREDKAGRLKWFARNVEFFGAPVGLFFTLDRRCGPPQWSDVGMFMQTFMLLAVERGLGTCAQEFWATLPKTVGEAIGLDADHMLFSGMSLGYPDEAKPINTLKTRREPFDAFADLIGF
jgi:nitroreductase